LQRNSTGEKWRKGRTAIKTSYLYHVTLRREEAP